MADHTNPYISQIKLPDVDQIYDIHDRYAIHSIGDLGLEEAMKFMGVKDTVAALPASGNTPGDVWHVVEDDQEYIWVGAHGSVAAHWEEFGSKFVVEHVHDFSASGSITNGSAAAQAWTQKTGSAAAQTWTQKTGTISGSGNVTVPKVTKSANYVKATSGNDTFVKSYPGTTNKLVQTTVKSAGANTEVINEVTPNTASIVPAKNSGSKFITSVAPTTKTIIPPKSSAKVSKATLSTNQTVGTQLTGGAVASWGASVTNGILSFSWSTNSLQNLSTASVPVYTFEEVSVATPGDAAVTVITDIGETVSTVNAATVDEAKTVVTSVSTDTVSVAGAGSDVTVATGTLASTGTGASVMTGLGTASTAKALTSVGLAEGTSTDGVLVGDTVAVTSEDKTVSITGSATVTGTNAASTVTVTGTNAASTVTGTVSHSGTTGAPKEA